MANLACAPPRLTPDSAKIAHFVLFMKLEPFHTNCAPYDFFKNIVPSWIWALVPLWPFLH